MVFSPNDPRIEKKIFGMTPDEAYEDYIKFCKENNMTAGTKEQFFSWNRIWDEMEPTND
jgi:hypothetical protein